MAVTLLDTAPVWNQGSDVSSEKKKFKSTFAICLFSSSEVKNLNSIFHWLPTQWQPSLSIQFNPFLFVYCQFDSPVPVVDIQIT